MLHRTILAGLAAAAAGPSSPFPRRNRLRPTIIRGNPITMIVPYPAGGGVDFMGRLVAQYLSVSFGQQVVVEYRGGAGGMIGTRDIAKAVPDGYTIGMMLTGISLSANTGYDINKDFRRSGSSPRRRSSSTPIRRCRRNRWPR